MDTNVENKLSSIQLSKNTRRECLQELQKEVQKLYEEQQKEVAQRKANLPPKNPKASSENKRRQTEPISPQVQALVAQKVMYEGSLTWEQATLAYDISHSSISQIVR